MVYSIYTEWSFADYFCYLIQNWERPLVYSIGRDHQYLPIYQYSFKIELKELILNAIFNVQIFN